MDNNNNHSDARIAHAAANIAKGASIGGLPGAVAGAVKSFLPEFVKFGAILIVLALLIPLLVFVGVPNIVFGYDNAVFDDIINLTDRAYYIDMAYRQIDNYSQECIDQIVAKARAAYSGESEIDEVSVESDLSNTDIYWLISINSVAYQQDLYAMDETSIKDMFLKKLIYSSFINTRTEGEGDDEVTIRTLKVNVKDINPEELMDKLGFTDEERDWARLLYSTLESERPLGPGYDGGYRVPGAALSDERFAAMYAEAIKYLGYPYVWGGSNPRTSFDCSGFVCWVINQSGVGSVGRTTAQGLYNITGAISASEAKPGDIIYFQGTYRTSDTVTHVGIYLGEGQMIHAGNPINISSIHTSYWTSHFYAFGRLP